MEYMALLCNSCNLNQWEVGADTPEGRNLLIRKNVARYGLADMRKAIDGFNDLILKAGMSSITFVDEILDEVEKEKADAK